MVDVDLVISHLRNLRGRKLCIDSVRIWSKCVGDYCNILRPYRKLNAQNGGNPGAICDCALAEAMRRRQCP